MQLALLVAAFARVEYVHLPDCAGRACMPGDGGLLLVSCFLLLFNQMRIIRIALDCFRF